MLSDTVAQESLAIGAWRTHLPYRRAFDVTNGPETVFYNAGQSIIRVDKTENSVDFLDKVNALSGVNIRLLRYNSESDILLVAYNGSVIDLVKPDGVRTLSDISNFNNIPGDKPINDVHFDGPNDAYLAASYGVSKLNLERNIFEFTTFTGISVNDVATLDGAIFIGTNEGIYFAPATIENINDFGQWQRVEVAPEYRTTTLQSYKNELYFAVDNAVFSWNNGNPELFYQDDSEFELVFMSAEGRDLVVGFSCGDCDGKVLFLDENGLLRTDGTDCVNRPLYAVQDENGNAYYADDFRFLRSQSAGADRCDRDLYNSPWSELSYDLTYANDALWVAPGNVDPTFSALGRRDGLFRLRDGVWTIYRQTDFPEFAELLDFLAVEVHPETGLVYGGSYYGGLVELNPEDNSFTIYDQFNSSLGGTIGDEQRTRISGLAFDQDNNLWISNFGAERAVSVLTNEGETQSFDFSICGSSERQPTSVVVDDFGFKWFITSTASTGVIVLDTGPDITDTSDDRCRIFTSNNSQLPSNQVNAITVDLEGDVWVGTPEGAVVFQCGPSVFELDICDATQITSDQDEFNLGFLLSGNDVRTIAVDGANQKWFGTNDGIFVQSSDGKETVARYTEDNSPLLDNEISSITINQADGTVYIGTASGIMSVRGEATGGGPVHQSEVYAFPNPVRPDYFGPVAIKGLAENSNVKITDVNGQMVYETRAKGGQAIWDANDYGGRRVATGVYLVFATSRNATNPDAVATKILVVN